MSNPNRTAQLTKIHKVLRKHYKPATPPNRTLLEHLLYACCLENARVEAADEAFAKLQEMFCDWNEVRVTTVAELTETLGCLPDAAEAAGRLKRSLQNLFESYYSFDLEALKKQNLGKAEKDLEKISGGSAFVLAYVVQNALGGHSIPVNKGALDVLFAVGAISDAEAAKLQVPGLERAIPKNKGVEFGSLLHQIGADFFASPGSSKLKAMLAEIDGDFKDRLSQRQARLDKEAADAAAKVAAERVKERDRRVKARTQAQAEAAKKAAKEAAKQARSAKGATPAGKTLPPATIVPSAKTPPPTKVAPSGKSPPPPAKETPTKTPPAKAVESAKPAEAAKDKAKDKDKKPADRPAADKPASSHVKDKDGDKKKVSKGLAKKKPR